ncbi:LysR family transcriptional regulator [Providencia rettgeri]|uniref:LysR family transcriptional regulator n=1 Tax=Providencia sp. TaxID=589 RepID=UPI0024AAABF0|nr:LysR family transcriptional regulator [Providencia rettgeri]ELR5233780.1 LysR family transcriptional regulator [Providencia rettgeri]
MDKLIGVTHFIHTAQLHSFAEAAKQLHISPSAVSKGVSRLEERLGVRLLQRSTRSVSLTAEGEIFLARCLKIMGELTQAERELHEAKRLPQGRLKISLPLISTLMLPLLSDFSKLYPQIELDIDFSDRLVDVTNEGFDAVIRTGELKDSRLVSKSIGISQFFCVASPKYCSEHGIPQEPKELENHLCLVHRFPSTGLIEKWWMKYAADIPAYVDITPVSKAMVSNHLDSLLFMAVNGHGIAYLPDFSIAEKVKKGELIILLDEWVGMKSEFHILWPSNYAMLPKLRVFINFMHNAFLK